MKKNMPHLQVNMNLHLRLSPVVLVAALLCTADYALNRCDEALPAYPAPTRPDLASDAGLRSVRVDDAVVTFAEWSLEATANSSLSTHHTVIFLHGSTPPLQMMAY